jgi:hypothetical protein
VLTEVAIRNPPSPSTRYGVTEVIAIQPQVAGQNARRDFSRDFTDVDYVAVETYLKTGRSLMLTQRAPVESVTPGNERVAGSVGRARAAIALYTAIFNYRGPPAPALSIQV